MVGSSHKSSYNSLLFWERSSCSCLNPGGTIVLVHVIAIYTFVNLPILA